MEKRKMNENAPMSVSLTDEQKSIVRDAVKECIASRVRCEAEKDLQKDIAERIKEKFGIKPAVFNAIVGEAYEKKVTNQIEKLTEAVELAEMIMHRDLS
jgi:hypothetical protein